MIIIGTDDFQRCAELAGRVGKWRAWSEGNFPRYEEVFSAMLKYLYRCSLTDLRDAVETLDFQHALSNAREFFRADGLSTVENLLVKSKEACPFDQDFDLYLLIGLGHVDGTSLPGKKPFLYFGLERYVKEALSYLAPHEYNHMVRLWSLYHGEIDGLSFGDMVISEGLAVVFSAAVARGDPLDAGGDEHLMTDEEFRYCMENRDALMAEVLGHWQEPYGPELARRYMQGGDRQDGIPGRSGYFVGAEIVRAVMGTGIELSALTRMPTAEITAVYHRL